MGFVVSPGGKFFGVANVAGRCLFVWSVGRLVGFDRPDPTTRLVLEDNVQGVDDAGDVWEVWY